MNPTEDARTPEARNADGGWRFRVGVALFVLANALPIIGLILVPALGVPAGWSAALVGLSFAGGPDVLLVASAAVMGRENMQRLLSASGAWIARKVRWNTVSRRRYRIGLWLTLVAIAIPIVVIYGFTDSIADGGSAGWGLYVILVCDLLLVAAFLTMGAPLWERIRAIVSLDARISHPD